jgi:hypothetical protein
VGGHNGDGQSKPFSAIALALFGLRSPQFDHLHLVAGRIV